jgi:hypothetical protein
MTKAIMLRAGKAPVLAHDLKAVDGSSLVGRNGELNASSKKDLLTQQQRFLQASSQGVMLNVDATTGRELVAAAFNDKDAHRVLGEKISDALYITANRQGFMRKYLAKIDVAQGSVPRFQLRTKNVTAVWSTSPTKIQSQLIRDKYFTPPEFQVVARPFVPTNELNQSSGDVLQEKFIEGVEATMVAEDRVWYNQVNALVGVDNPLTVVSGQLTPYSLMTVVGKVTAWGLKGAHLLMASDMWQDIIGNSDFYQAIDPVARHELLLTGELATMYGMTITSDAFRHPEHKVLGAGEFYVISDALNHGAYSDRGGLKSTPIDISHELVPGRGFVIEESLAVSVANSRSVAKGQRV